MRLKYSLILKLLWYQLQPKIDRFVRKQITSWSLGRRNFLNKIVRRTFVSVYKRVNLFQRDKCMICFHSSEPAEQAISVTACFVYCLAYYKMSATTFRSNVWKVAIWSSATFIISYDKKVDVVGGLTIAPTMLHTRLSMAQKRGKSWAKEAQKRGGWAWRKRGAVEPNA